MVKFPCNQCLSVCALRGLEGGHCAPHFWAIFQVEPFASLSEAVRSSVPRLLINRDLVGPFAWRPRSRDVVQLGDMVHGVERLVELLGWTEELQDLMQQEDEKVQTAGSSPGLPSSLLWGLGPPGVEPCWIKQ